MLNVFLCMYLLCGCFVACSRNSNDVTVVMVTHMVDNESRSDIKEIIRQRHEERQSPRKLYNEGWSSERRGQGQRSHCQDVDRTAGRGPGSEQGAGGPSPQRGRRAECLCAGCGPQKTMKYSFLHFSQALVLVPPAFVFCDKFDL